MKRFRSSLSSLEKAVKVIICSIVFGFLAAVVLAHVALAFYIATCEEPYPVLEYLDAEPEKSIRSGF